MTVPPLGVVTGAILPPEVFGGFGPADAFLWRGACIGGCGARPGCRKESTRPECSGCGRLRHGVTDGPHGTVGPVVHALGAGWRPPSQPVNLPVNQPVNGPVVLRPATDVRPDDPALPAGVRRLVAIAPAGTRATLAVAADADGVPVASLAVRVPGVGFAVYERRGEGGAWRFANAVAVAPRPRHRLPARLHLQRANVGRFTAALLGEEYDAMPALDVAPPTPAPIGVCPSCGADVRLTQAGAIYANHRCKSKTIEGRS